MTTLVTGGLGAIGSAVVRRLVQEGIRTVAFDHRRDTELIDDVLPQVTVEVGDVRDWALLARLIRANEVESIIHMAALLPDDCQRDPKLASDVNLGATISICELARALALRRVVFASSKGVYQKVEGRHAHPQYDPVDEDYPIGPDGVYDVTKYAAEQLGLNFSQTYGVDFIAFRFAATYGPGRMSRHGALAIRSSIIEDAFFGRSVRVPRGGDQMDDFVYTKDVAQALVHGITVEQVSHRVFNIGTGKLSSLNDAAEIIRRHLPDADIEVGPGTDYGASGRYCLFDISRAQAELGYDAKFDHERGIADYISVLEESRDGDSVET